MKMKSNRALAAGQVWKTSAADIKILGLGKRLIHYRITKRLGHQRVSAQISKIEAMADYLKRNEAQLVGGLSSN